MAENAEAVTAMDEVVEQFQFTGISNGNSARPSGNLSMFELYKNWGRLDQQEQRRKEILEMQKQHRSNRIDTFRGIMDIVKSINHGNIFKYDMTAYYRPSLYVAGFNKAKYGDLLMMSEWLVEKPMDFEKNWLVVACPKATRVLVVVCYGATKLFTKYGQFIMQCRTELPGGNPSHPKANSVISAFDCFYHENSKTLFVLDILAWNNQPMTDGEAEFRSFWLTSQLHEIPQLKVLSKKNHLKFSVLRKESCSAKSFQNFMMTYPHFENPAVQVDGLLFYHKHAQYVGGESPLVGWLYPFMVPEVLGMDIPIHTIYALEKPESYVNQAEFIRDFEKKYTKKKIWSKKNESKVPLKDTSPTTKVTLKASALQEGPTDISAVEVIEDM